MAEKKTGTSRSTKRRLPWPLLFIFLFLTMAIVGSGYFYFQNQKKNVIHEQTAQLQAIADLKTANIERWLKDRTGDARLIMENPFLTTRLLTFLSENANGRLPEPIRLWMTSVRNNFDYQNVMVLDKSGQVAFFLNEQYPVLGDDGLDMLEAVRLRKSAAISDLYISAAVPFPHLDIFLPLKANSEIAGFVLMRIDPAQYLFPLIQKWPTPSPSAETLLVRREGDDVLFLNELRHRKNTALKMRLPITSGELPAATAILGRTGTFSGRDYRGIAVWSVVRPIRGSPWFIVAKIDREEIERPVRRSALAIFLVTLALVLAAFLLIFILWQRQYTHLRQIQFKTLLEKEEKFKHVFETANVAKSITKPTGEIQVNKAFCDMLGYSQEELQKKKWQDLTPAEEVEPIQRLLEPLLSGRKDAARFNKRYIHKNGSHVWGDVSVAMHRDPGGKPLHFITTIVDITEHKHMEDALKSSENKLRTVLDATQFPIAIVDLQDDKITYWSRSALTLFGHTAPTTTGWYEIAYPDPDYRRDVVERWKPFLDKARLSGQPVNTGEYRVTCRDGSVRICELYATFLVDNLVVTFNDITERKRAEKKLHDSEEHLRSTLDNMMEGCQIISFDWRYLFVNNSVVKHSRQTKEALLGHTMMEVYPGIEKTEMFAVLRRCMEERHPQHLENEFAYPDGTKEWFELSIQPIPEGVFILSIDINKRKKVEEEIKSAKVFLEMVIDMSPFAMWISDKEGTVTKVNHSLCQAIHLAEDQIVGKYNVFSDTNLADQGVMPRVKAVFEKHEPARFQILWQAASAGSVDFDGARDMHIDVSMFPILDAQGELTNVVCQWLDISDWKKAEDEIKKLSARNQALLEAVPDIIMEVDTNKVYTWANRTGIEFFGDDVIDKEASDYFLGEQEVYQTVKPIFNGYEDIIYVESWQRRHDGEKRLLAWWCRVLKDVSGNVTGALSSARDITEIKLAENEIIRLNDELEERVLQRTTQLQAANKELEAFSYSVSHDLRAPLRAIEGFSRIVLEEYAAKLDDEARRLLAVITANTRKMGLLIDDLLAFSRLSRQQMAFRPVDLAAMADTVFTELAGTKKGRKIKFKIGALPTAFGDHAMLRQVLQNLLANAIKFTRPRAKPRIEITGREGSGESIYQVKDNGVGFDMEYVDKLFGVFQRLHGSEEFEGTGVGLAIVQRVILRHGGRVWAKSKGGKGATFYFAIPNDKDTGDRGQGTENEPLQGTGYRGQGTGKREQSIAGQKKK